MNTNPLLTERETTAYLRVKPSTLRKWRREGSIPFVKLGACVRYRHSDLEALIAASLKGSIADPTPYYARAKETRGF